MSGANAKVENLKREKQRKSTSMERRKKKQQMKPTLAQTMRISEPVMTDDGKGKGTEDLVKKGDLSNGAKKRKDNRDMVSGKSSGENGKGRQVTSQKAVQGPPCSHPPELTPFHKRKRIESTCEMPIRKRPRHSHFSRTNTVECGKKYQCSIDDIKRDSLNPHKRRFRVLVDYELPEGEDRAEWDTDYLRLAFGEVECETAGPDCKK